jgi:hypothetical protein
MKNGTTMEKIKLGRRHVSLPNGGFECIGPTLKPLKLIHLFKIYGIHQANRILVLDVLNAF